MVYYVPRLKKWGGHVPRVPHTIAPMVVSTNFAKTLFAKVLKNTL